jgi:hypothetical protein
MGDRAGVEAELLQLPARDHPVLPRRPLCNRPIGWDLFVMYVGMRRSHPGSVHRAA